MGYVVNQYVIVSGTDPHLAEARDEAIRIFGRLVSPVMPHTINNTWAFFINASGSKWGWEEQKNHSASIKKFTDYCREKNFYNLVVVVEIPEEVDHSKILDTIRYVERD